VSRKPQTNLSYLRPEDHLSTFLTKSRSFSKHTEAKTRQNCRFSSSHYPTTMGGNSIETILKAICYNRTHTKKKWRNFSFNSSRVVRSGMSFPTRCLPRPEFLCGKDTVHWNTPYTAHVPTALYKLQTKPWNKYILYLRYAIPLEKNSAAKFQDIWKYNSLKICNFGMFWALYIY